MLNKLWKKSAIALGIFVAFTTVYKLLERKGIYSNTLGKLTLNYKRINDTTVKELNTPFTEFTESNSYNWDAAYYHKLKDSLYKGTSENIIYRYAFYPFFPIVWKVTHVNGHGIVLLNFIFFALSIILLSSIFLRGSPSEMFFFILALLLPTSVVFYLPYTEATFFLTFSIALVGLLKKKYWLFFLAMLCLSMTRPTGMILMVVFILANTVALIGHKRISIFLKDCILSVLPIFIGWFLVMLLQYSGSGSWSTYLQACTLWVKQPDLLLPVRDWSVEGFGMTTFAIFFFAIPACIYVIVWGISSLTGKDKDSQISIFNGDKEYIKRYMFKFSLLFIMGFMLFSLLTNGYQLNGIYRYTMATPFFFIVLFQLPEKLNSIPIEYKVSAFIVLMISTLIFLFSSWFTGNLFRFQYMGFYLLLLLAVLILIEPHLSKKKKIIVLVVLLIPCILWHAYLFNMYLSNAWIFT